MFTINSVIVSGRVTQDPQLRDLKGGEKLAKFGVAVSKYGKSEKHTMFIDIQAWASQADYVMRNLKKGTAIIVEGELASEQWRSKTGEFKSRLVIKPRNIQKLYVDEQFDDGSAEEGGERPAASSPVPEEYGPPPTPKQNGSRRSEPVPAFGEETMDGGIPF